MKFFYTHKIFLLELFPGGRIQAQQHREQLQPAGQHIKHEHIFTQHGKTAKIHCRPHLGKTGPILLNVAATAVKLVTRSNSSSAMTSTEAAKITR